MARAAFFTVKRKEKYQRKGRDGGTQARGIQGGHSAFAAVLSKYLRAESRRRAAHLLARTGGTNGTDRVTDQAGFQLLRRLRSAGLWLQHRKAPGGAGRHSGTACGTTAIAPRRQLGRALLNNFNFSASGFELLCAFDANPDLIGRSFGGHEVKAAGELDAYIAEHHPDVAVLTIPRGNAPAIARDLVERGVRGLWNFTGEDLHLEGLGVPVENVHLSDSLMTLCQLVGMAEESDN